MNRNRLLLRLSSLLFCLLLLLTALLAARAAVAAPVAPASIAPAPVAPAPVAPAALQTGTATVRFGGATLLNAAADGATAVVTADLDGDGDLDVVSASRDDGKLIWYRNNGATPPVFDTLEIDTVAGAAGLFAGDINGDGAVDIAVAGSGLGRILWYANDGGHTPAFSRYDAAVDLSEPVALFGLDLDRDGDLDLLSASRGDNRILWHENNGAAQAAFTTHLVSDAYAGATAVHAGDLDGDGDPDVVAAAADADVIAWFEHNGAALPQFTANVIRTAGSGHEAGKVYAATVQMADLDGDGDNDIVYGSTTANEVGWYANNGAADPSFSPRVISTEIRGVQHVLAADVDGDGDADLLSASAGDNRIVIYDNDGRPEPAFTGRELATGLAGARALAVADVNGNGQADVLAAAGEADQVVWFPNQGIHRSALFHEPGRHVIDTQFRMRHLTSGDLNNDGHVDVVTVSGVEVIVHFSDGAQPPAFRTMLISRNLDGGRWVDVADLDGDGDLDVVAASTNNGTIYWFENQGESFVERVASNRLDGARAALTGDVDGDGDMDIFAASHGDNRITWYENQGGAPPSFVQHVVTDGAAYARSVYGADVNGDGHLDLLSASQHDNMVRWYRNNGARPPAFTPFDLTSADGVLHVHAADVNGDGDMDVLFAAEHASTIGWLENLGGAQPGFVRHDVDTNALAAHAVTAADLDSDGDTDLVGAIEGLNAIIWYENVGGEPIRFVRRVAYDKALVAHGVHVDDLDGDGDTDILSASREDGVAAWFENQGGQYAIGVEAALSSALIPGQWQQFAAITAAHRGRDGDADIELANLELLFVDDGGRLNTQAVNSRIDQLALYRDADGDNHLDPQIDTPLVAVDQLILTDDGRLVLPVPQGSATVASRRSATFFLGAMLTGECADAAPAFTVLLQLTAGTAVDNRHETPLLADGMRSLDAAASAGDAAEQSPLLINEIMADNNVTLEDPQEAGEFPDWIEIYNAGPVAANLAGMYLTDDLEQPTKYRIPEGVTIPPFGYLVFIADGDFAQGPLHTNFRLDRTGEAVALFDRDVNGNRVVDVIAFEDQAPDVAFGRLPDGGETIMALPLSTPGIVNTAMPLDVSIYLPIVHTGRTCQ